MIRGGVTQPLYLCPAEVPDRQYPAQDVWLSRKSSRLWRGRLEAKYWSQVGVLSGAREVVGRGASTTMVASQDGCSGLAARLMPCVYNTGTATAWLLGGCIGSSVMLRQA